MVYSCFKKNEACCGAHNLAEIYSSLTGRTGRERVSARMSSALGISGGTIYDALLTHCAIKAKAQAIYTWNTKDFTRLGPDITGRVKAPAA